MQKELIQTQILSQILTQMDHGPKCKTQNYKIPKDNTEENLGDLE